MTVAVEGQDSTKEPPCLACLRAPTKGRLKEVNLIKQGVEQP